MVMTLDVPNLSPHGSNVWELLSITSRPNRKRRIELKQMSQVTGYAFWKRHNTHGKNQDLAAGFLLAKLPYLDWIIKAICLGVSKANVLRIGSNC